MPNLSSTSHIHFFIILSSFLFSLSLADHRGKLVGVSCGPSFPPKDGNYFTNFHEATDLLYDEVKTHRYGHTKVGSYPTVYALTECMRDLNDTECSLCFNLARTNFTKCLASSSIRIYMDGCFLRYDNYSFFEESTDKTHDKVVCAKPNHPISDDKVYQKEFSTKVRHALDVVTTKTLNHNLFGVTNVTGGIMSVYAMAQCWSTLDSGQCELCLHKAAVTITKCLPNMIGRALNAGCYMRYSTEDFVNPYVIPDQHEQKIGIVIKLALGSLSFSLLALGCAYAAYRYLSEKGKEHNSIALSTIIRDSELTFKYETLEKATSSFDPSRKIGQGAAGSVFKATLSDGSCLAVKRLFFNTRQWTDEFFNEVNLISGIKHKNLVQLLGCSIEGPESLLVYEYVPYGSLDQLLFDKNKYRLLTWEKRFQIVLGIAEGLAFLHGGGNTSTKLIHRDIKCSNILLDENLGAKVGDFGLVRCCGADKTHISTVVAGTLGYLAPEYLVRGNLTEKADVYSFGVLVIEIVCGRRNNVFMLESGSILSTVWKNYESSSMQESVDSRLRGDFAERQACNVLQIALLCTQSSARSRPSMSEVVKMLTDRDYRIPSPKEPPFLNSAFIENETLTSGSMEEPKSDGSGQDIK